MGFGLNLLYDSPMTDNVKRSFSQSEGVVRQRKMDVGKLNCLNTIQFGEVTNIEWEVNKFD